MSNLVKSSYLTLALVLTACGGKSESGGSGGANGGSAGSGGSGAGATGGSGAVDGGSGGMGAGGAGGTSSGGAPGGGGAPCASLEEAYTSSLAKAKVCNPFIDFEECTTKVPDALACPCGVTYVNPANAEAVKSLADIKYFWDQQQCGANIDCPAIDCEPPAFGSCQPDSATATGACTNMFTNE